MRIGLNSLWDDPIHQQRFLSLLLILLALPLLLVRLDSWPATWFDEGAFLQGAKNIALYGKYATLSAGEFSRFDPILTGAGPTVLIPIAALFRLFAVGLIQGRIVSVLYALAAIWLCFNLAIQMVSKRVAMLATALMILSPWGDFVQMGRFAMGEMASLAFVLAGLYLWWRSIDQDSSWWSAGSGVSFGLALLSKPQNAIALAALLLTGLVDRIYYRRLGFRRWGIPLLVALFFFVGWQGYQVTVLGPSEWMARLQTGDTVSRALATVSRPGLILVNLENLAKKSGYLLWTFLAIVYFGFEILCKKRDGGKEFFLLAMVSIWLLWFILGSIGWGRYAFVPISLSSVLLGRLFGYVTDGFYFDYNQIHHALRQTNISFPLVQLSLALLAVFMIGYGALIDVNNVFRGGDQSAQQMAEYLDTHLERGVLIETWEWEIAFLTHHNYHHPPFEVLEAMVRRVNLGMPFSDTLYDFQQFHPGYLIDGPFSKWTQLYPEAFLQEQCELVTSVGEYDLYRIARP
jgi:4-amino-4-deoxy-L-arabinose transferase-like glycosyltransferase